MGSIFSGLSPLIVLNFNHRGTRRLGIVAYSRAGRRPRRRPSAVIFTVSIPRAQGGPLCSPCLCGKGSRGDGPVDLPVLAHCNRVENPGKLVRSFRAGSPRHGPWFPAEHYADALRVEPAINRAGSRTYATNAAPCSSLSGWAPGGQCVGCPPPPRTAKCLLRAAARRWCAPLGSAPLAPALGGLGHRTPSAGVPHR